MGSLTVGERYVGLSSQILDADHPTKLALRGSETYDDGTIGDGLVT
jgi:hypothetical protein